MSWRSTFRRRRVLGALALLTFTPSIARGEIVAAIAGAAAQEGGKAALAWFVANAEAISAGAALAGLAQSQQDSFPEIIDIGIALDPDVGLVVGDDANVAIRVTGSFGAVNELFDTNGDGLLTVEMESKGHPRQVVGSEDSNQRGPFDIAISPKPLLEAHRVGDDTLTVYVTVEGEDNTDWTYDKEVAVKRTETRAVVVRRPYDLVGSHPGESYWSPQERVVGHGDTAKTYLHVKKRATERGEMFALQNGGAILAIRDLEPNDVRNDERLEMALEWAQGHNAAHPCEQKSMFFELTPLFTSYRIRSRVFDVSREGDWESETEILRGITFECKAECTGAALAPNTTTHAGYYGYAAPTPPAEPTPRQVSFRLLDRNGGGVPGSYLVLRDYYGNAATLEPDPEGTLAAQVTLADPVVAAVFGGPYHMDFTTTLYADELDAQEVLTLAEVNTPDIVGHAVDDFGEPIAARVYLIPGDPEMQSLLYSWLETIPAGTHPVAPAWLTAQPRFSTVDGEFHVSSLPSLMSMGPDPSQAALVVVPKPRLGRAFAGTPVAVVPVDLTERQTLDVGDVVLAMEPPVVAMATIDYVFSWLDAASESPVPLAGVHIVAVDPATGVTVADATSDPFGGLTLTVPAGIPIELRVDPAEAAALGVVAPPVKRIQVDRDTAITRQVPVARASIDAIGPTAGGFVIAGRGAPGQTVELAIDDGTPASVVVASDGTFTAEVTAATGATLTVRQVVAGGAGSRWATWTLDEATILNLALAHIHEDRTSAVLDLDGDGAVGVTDLQRIANAL